jgi:hypothetical protein
MWYAIDTVPEINEEDGYEQFRAFIKCTRLYRR